MSTNPGRVIGSYETPGYREQRVAQFAALLAGIGERYRERQEKKRQKEEAELDFFFRAAQTYPEIAASPYAEQVKAKWGEKRPEVMAVIEAIANRGELRKQSEGSLNQYLDTLGQAEADYSRWEQAAQQPAFLPLPPDIAGPPVPDPEVIAAQEQLQKTPRAVLPLMAAQKLTPKQRAAARIEAKRQGIELPQEPDPFADLPAESKALLMGEMGLLKGEPIDAVRYKVGIESSPADIDYRTWATGEAATKEERALRREEFEKSERLARDAHDIKMEGTRYAHRMNEIAAQKDQEDEERGIAPKPAAAAKELATLAEKTYVQEYKEWVDGLQASTKGIKSAEKRAIARDLYLGLHPKPKRVPPAVARKVITRIEEGVAQGSITPEEADLMATEYMGRVMSAVARGQTIEQALKEQDPGNKDFDSAGN